jgi:hypothetical protein
MSVHGISDCQVPIANLVEREALNKSATGIGIKLWSH